MEIIKKNELPFIVEKEISMVHHIVMWNFIPELNEQEKQEAFLKIKGLLEPICELAEGAVEIKVINNQMNSSNRQIMLKSSFENEEALQNYIIHPAHVEAGKYVRSVVCDRACVDYEES